MSLFGLVLDMIKTGIVLSIFVGIAWLIYWSIKRNILWARNKMKGGDVNEQSTEYERLKRKIEELEREETEENRGQKVKRDRKRKKESSKTNREGRGKSQKKKSRSK